MKVLLLSAYTAASHQYWLDGLQKHLTDIDWTIRTLPPRHFSWRIRGNSLTWAFTERQTLEQHYDCLLATSMVDLSALRGLVPALTNIRTVVYFHENQFVYPQSSEAAGQAHPAIEPQLVNLYTALCADDIVFNSDYNRHTFLQGVTRLREKLPDGFPSNIESQLRKRSTVVPVPLELETEKQPTQRCDDKFHLIWNHRWEYDKGPERLYQCLQYLPRDLPLIIHVVGQQFRQRPNIFNAIKKYLSNCNWLGHWGFIENRRDYLQLLRDTDGVLSTALHDFQGLSVLEAYALGCIPLVPDRLAYREFIPEDYRYASDLKYPENEARSAAEKIIRFCQTNRAGSGLIPMPVKLEWDELAERYRRLLGA